MTTESGPSSGLTEPGDRKERALWSLKMAIVDLYDALGNPASVDEVLEGQPSRIDPRPMVVLRVSLFDNGRIMVHGILPDVETPSR